MTTKKIPTSEAALKRSLADFGLEEATFHWAPLLHRGSDIKIWFEDSVEPHEILWQGYLSDFYKKRKPLKGIVKKLKKAVR